MVGAAWRLIIGLPPSTAGLQDNEEVSIYCCHRLACRAIQELNI